VLLLPEQPDGQTELLLQVPAVQHDQLGRVGTAIALDDDPAV
jgi:hypothetical protein